jgi:hypothetical protein
MPKHLTAQHGFVSLATIILLFGVVTVYAYAAYPASPSEIATLAQSAKASPAAQALLKRELTLNPSPSEWDMSVIRNKVNAQLTKEVIRVVTTPAATSAALHQ